VQLSKIQREENDIIDKQLFEQQYLLQQQQLLQQQELQEQQQQHEEQLAQDLAFAQALELSHTLNDGSKVFTPRFPLLVDQGAPPDPTPSTEIICEENFATVESLRSASTSAVSTCTPPPAKKQRPNEEVRLIILSMRKTHH